MEASGGPPSFLARGTKQAISTTTIASLPQECLCAILSFAVTTDWGQEDGPDLVCKVWRNLCFSIRWRLNHRGGKVEIKAGGFKTRLLHKWLPNLCELTVTVRSAYLQEDVAAFQCALLESGELAQCFPHLQRIVLQPDNEETLDKSKSYSLDLGTTPGAGVLVLRHFPLPDSIPRFFTGIELYNIVDPTEFNLKAIAEANHIESFRIFRVMRMESFFDGSQYERSYDNGMVAEHLALLPRSLKRLDLVGSGSFQCGGPGPIAWPPALTELCLDGAVWLSNGFGATGTHLEGLKKLALINPRGPGPERGVCLFDTSALPAGLEELVVTCTQLTGPLPPRLKLLSIDADGEELEVTEPRTPTESQDIEEAAAAMRATFAAVDRGGGMSEMMSGADDFILAKIWVTCERSGVKPTCIPFVLALSQLPQSLEVLELTGISKYVLEDIEQRLTVTGSFSSSMRLREVRSEHEAVLLHLKAAGAPLTTHLHFILTPPKNEW